MKTPFCSKVLPHREQSLRISLHRRSARPLFFGSKICVSFWFARFARVRMMKSRNGVCSTTVIPAQNPEGVPSLSPVLPIIGLDAMGSRDRSLPWVLVPQIFSPLLAKIFHQGQRHQYEERGKGRGACVPYAVIFSNQLHRSGEGEDLGELGGRLLSPRAAANILQINNLVSLWGENLK